MAWSQYPIQTPKAITLDLQGHNAETNAFGIGPQRFYLAANKSGQNRLLMYDWTGAYLPHESFDIIDTTAMPAALRRAYGNLYIVLEFPPLPGAILPYTRSFIYPYSLTGVAGNRLACGFHRITAFEQAPNNGFYTFRFLVGNHNYTIYYTDGTVSNIGLLSGIPASLAVCQTASEFFFMTATGTITATGLNFVVDSGSGGSLDSENTQPRAIDYYQGLIGVYDARGQIYLYGDFPETPDPLPSVKQIHSLGKFLEPYDVITFGSGRAVAAVKRKYAQMVEQSAVEELQFRADPTLETILKTVELTPKYTIPTAKVGDAILNTRVPSNQIDADGMVNKAYTYPSPIPAGVKYFEIDGFKKVARNKGQVIIGTEKVTE